MSLQNTTPEVLDAPRTQSKIEIVKKQHTKTFLCSLNKKCKETSIYASLSRASYTIEATIIMPIVVTMMVFVIFIFRILQVESGMQQAIDTASRRIAVLGQTELLGERLSDDQQLLAAISYVDVLLAQYHVPTEYITGGLLGLDYSESQAAGNYVDLKVKYGVKFPVGLLGRFSYDVVQESKNRKWVGYDPNENAWDGIYVYVTEYGSVYHRSQQCTYLNPSVQGIGAANVAELRNQSGGIYYPCSSCHGNSNSGTVYITDYGTNYHSDLNCSKLKRRIRRVLYDQVKDYMDGCSKCGR